jgi:hypothetical protein
MKTNTIHTGDVYDEQQSMSECVREFVDKGMEAEQDE